MQIHQSAEDYLETILMLNQRMGRVRSIDVVNELGYTKASVSIAMKKLRENGYIAVDPSRGASGVPLRFVLVVCHAVAVRSTNCIALPRAPLLGELARRSRDGEVVWRTAFPFIRCR